MKKKKLFGILFFLFGFVTLTGCNQGENSNIIEGMPFEQEMPLIENGDILLTIPDVWNTHKIGESIGLDIQNLSERDFIYNQNDIQIYYLDNAEKWIKVNNKVVYLGGEQDIVVGSPTANSGALTTVSEFVDPDFHYSQTTYVRVIIVGRFLMENGTKGEQMATYIDVLLNP